MRQALAEQSRFGILAQLLGIFEGTDVGIKVAEVHLGIGVDLLPVPVREGGMMRWCRTGHGGPQLCLARGSGREVRLAQIPQLGVQVRNEGVLGWRKGSARLPSRPAEGRAAHYPMGFLEKLVGRIEAEGLCWGGLVAL